VRRFRHRLQVLEPRAPPLGIPRAQRRGDERVEQARLAIGGRAERAQMTRRDAVAPQRLACLGNVGVRLRVEPLAALDPRLEQAELLELPGPPRFDPRAFAERVEVKPFLGLAERRPLAAPLLAGTRGELLADHAQRQELVALEAQDRLEPLDVVLAAEPVAALRPLGRQETLVLEVPDLRDRGVGVLRFQPATHGADREQALAGWSGRRHQRVRKVRRYLPIWISSPSSRAADSTRFRLTNVPLRLPASSIIQRPSRCTSEACLRETVTSSRKMPQSGERPIVVLSPCGANVSPARPPPAWTTSAGPWMPRSPSVSSISSCSSAVNDWVCSPVSLSRSCSSAPHLAQ